MTSTEPPSMRVLLGLCACAAAVFVVELGLMRAVAQVAWPPFAFVALSAAMLGGGLAGTLLALSPRALASNRLAAVGAFVVAIGGPAAMGAVLVVGLEPLRVGHDVAHTCRFAGVLGAMAMPFAGLSIVLTSLLAHTPARSVQLYAADLVGAALGSFCSVVLLDVFGAAGTGVIGGIIGSLAALCLARSSRGRAVAAACVVVLAAALSPARALVPRVTVDKRVGTAPAREVLARLQQAGRLHTREGADGRVDVLPAQPQPALLLDVGAAVTRAPDFPMAPAPRDSAAAGFVAAPPGGADVLVIGAGGGWEVARALAWGARHVDAIEVAGAVVQAARDGSIATSQRLYADPRVTLVHDEARSYLERCDDGATRCRWRSIVAVHTITNAAVTARAMRLAEDHLLTRESMRTLLRHLDDDGTLYLTRPANQIALLADLARDALRAEGFADDDVDRHIALLQRTDVDDPFFRGLLVARHALDLRTLPAPPAHAWSAPPARTGSRLPDDDRPFFHRLAEDVDARLEARLRVEGRGLADDAVAWVGGVCTALGVALVLAPLRMRRAGRRTSLPPLRAQLIAMLLGVAFMMLELSLAQRLTLACGRPALAFAAVVGGMLAGAGGLALVAHARAWRMTLRASLSACSAAALASVALPAVLGALHIGALGAASRLAVVAAASAVVALPLGLPFPTLIARESHRASAAAPWLYGLNATTGVAATALHAAVAPETGLVGTTIAAALCWALAAIIVGRSPDGPA